MLGLRVLTAMLLGRSSWNHEPISKYNMLGILEFVCKNLWSLGLWREKGWFWVKKKKNKRERRLVHGGK